MMSIVIHIKLTPPYNAPVPRSTGVGSHFFHRLVSGTIQRDIGASTPTAAQTQRMVRKGPWKMAPGPDDEDRRKKERHNLY